MRLHNHFIFCSIPLTFVTINLKEYSKKCQIFIKKCVEAPENYWSESVHESLKAKSWCLIPTACVKGILPECLKYTILNLYLDPVPAIDFLLIAKDVLGQIPKDG